MKIIKKYVHLLASTDKETIKKIKDFESKGLLNEHLDTNPAPFTPVDEKYQYLPKNIFKKMNLSFKRTFFVNPLMRYTNKFFQTIVVGQENLKNIKSAITVSNHVNKLDCMVIQHALKPHKTYFTAAEFNNMTGFIGDMMRAGRMLPMSSTYGGQKNFLNAIEKLLKKKTFVNFFPERSEWWGYEKPRPQNNGAYHIAIKNNVPIIPIFITFKQTEASKKSCTGIKQFVVNILKPIYPDSNLTFKQNLEQMMLNCKIQWEKTYENFYKKKV